MSPNDAAYKGEKGRNSYTRGVEHLEALKTRMKRSQSCGSRVSITTIRGRKWNIALESPAAILAPWMDTGQCTEQVDIDEQKD